MKPIFKEELSKIKNKKILSYLNRINLPRDEIEQLKLVVLWESIESFDENRGCMFSTHLYNTCRFTYLKHINKRNQPLFEFVENSYESDTKILDNLPLLYKIVLEDRHVYKYTIVEMVQRYKLKKWQVKLLIDDAKNYLKTILD